MADPLLLTSRCQDCGQDNHELAIAHRTSHPISSNLQDHVVSQAEVLSLFSVSCSMVPVILVAEKKVPEDCPAVKSLRRLYLPFLVSPLQPRLCQVAVIPYHSDWQHGQVLVAWTWPLQYRQHVGVVPFLPICVSAASSQP